MRGSDLGIIHSNYLYWICTAFAFSLFLDDSLTMYKSPAIEVMNVKRIPQAINKLDIILRMN